MLLLVYLRKYYKKSKLNLGVFDTTQIQTIVNKKVMFHQWNSYIITLYMHVNLKWNGMYTYIIIENLHENVFYGP